MALPATDTFTGADSTALQTYSANWSINTGAFSIDTNAVYCNYADEAGAGWNADTFDNNQYAQGKILARSSPHVGVAVRVHTDGATDTYYGFYGNAGDCQLFKQVGGSWTQLGSNGTAWAVNDVVKLSASGTTLTPTKNGVTTGTPGAQTDTAITSGRAGLSGYAQGYTTLLDDWEGGNLGTAPTASRVPLVMYALRRRRL